MCQLSIRIVIRRISRIRIRQREREKKGIKVSSGAFNRCLSKLLPQITGQEFVERSRLAWSESKLLVLGDDTIKRHPTGCIFNTRLIIDHRDTEVLIITVRWTSFVIALSGIRSRRRCLIRRDISGRVTQGFVVILRRRAKYRGPRKKHKWR